MGTGGRSATTRCRSRARERTPAALLALVAAALAAGCAAVPPPPAASFEEIADARAALAGEADREWVYETLAELVPAPGGNAAGVAGKPPAEAVVVGRVVGARGLTGYRQQAGAPGVEPDIVEIPYDAADALWWTFVVDVEVDEVLHGDVPERIEVGFADRGPRRADEVLTGFAAMGTVVLLLHDAPDEAYPAGAWRVAQDGEALVTVDGDRLSAPFLRAPEAERFLAPAPTLSALRAYVREHAG